MSDPITSDSQGLLSRLGQWFKSGPEADALDSPGALANRHKRVLADDLDGRERQKRKTRVDQIRRAEFAELRSMLSQVTTSVESSHLASSRHTHSPERQRHVRDETRGKIDSIEEQMSRNWYATSQGTGSAASSHSANEIGGTGTSPSAAQRVMKTLVGEQLLDFAYPPEAVNAAIAYAIGDYISSEHILTSICTRKDRTDRLLTSWELRFELYLSINKKHEFEDAAIDFAGKFGKSPPIWTKAWGSNAPHVPPSVEMKNAAAGRPSHSQAAVLPSRLDADSFRKLLQQFSEAKLKGTFKIDWTELASLDVAVLPSLLTLFEHMANWPGKLEWQGEQNLARLLTQQTQISPKNADQRIRWLLLLQFWRICGDERRFEAVGLDFCVCQEESAPAWSPPHCELKILPHTHEEHSASELPNFEPTRLLVDDSLHAMSQHIVIDQESRQVRLRETLKGDIRREMARLPAPIPGIGLTIDCSELLRIDAQAASCLLTFLRQHEIRQGPIHLSGVHRLISIYLFSLGLPPQVTLSLISL